MNREVRVALPVALLEVYEAGMPNSLAIYHLLLAVRQWAQ